MNSHTASRKDDVKEKKAISHFDVCCSSSFSFDSSSFFWDGGGTCMNEEDDNDTSLASEIGIFSILVILSFFIVGSFKVALYIKIIKKGIIRKSSMICSSDLYNRS